MIDPKLLDVLNQASSLELFRLGTVIDKLLADPRRIIAIRQPLLIGQLVRFFNPQTGDLQDGRIRAMADRQVTIEQQNTRVLWKLPYAAIEPARVRSGPKVGPSMSAKVVVPDRADFRRGDQVSFEDRYLQVHIGRIVRVNPSTATVEGDGHSWRVPYRLLRAVLDADQPAETKELPDS
jgi:hypothetical protein